LKYFHIFILFSVLFGNIKTYPEARYLNYDIVEQTNDSISKWIDSSRNKKLKILKRKFYLHKAYKESLKVSNDSLRNIFLAKVSFTYYGNLKDSLMFRKINKQAIELSLQINDSLNLANNYWDLGNFFRNNSVKDSAYFNYVRAQKIFESLKNDQFAGSLLLNMALIQSDFKDYTGSEVTTIRALTLLKPLNNYKRIYQCYNNLGIIFNELGEYDKAIFYHNTALNYYNLILTENNFKENTLNNIGVVYQNKGDFNKAVEFFQLSLENDALQNQNPKIYARSLDNLASSKLRINETVNIKELLLEAYKIRDSIQDYSGMAVSKLHLAVYYAFIKDTVKAIQLANETMQLTRAKKNDRDLLASLLLLSKLDKEKGRTYSRQYIELNNRLLKQERTIRNKFARIRFETDEYIDQNTELSEQKAKLSEQKNLILAIGSVVLLIVLLITIIINQRSKNVKLILEKQQQKANEEIFDLMLVQQYKLDEGRRKEKKRISEELHDGVLSRLFGTRLMLNTLNDKTDNESILDRKKYINELQQVEEEVRNVSHELNERSLSPNIGFIDMVENLLENQSKISNFKYKINIDSSIIWEGLKGSFKMNLYRIIQEAIQNINKYAKANNVLIEFKKEENKLLLIINDDGKGFNTDVKRRGIGINNMKSRVQQLQGKISINSQLNSGTAILIETPC